MLFAVGLFPRARVERSLRRQTPSDCACKRRGNECRTDRGDQVLAIKHKGLAPVFWADVVLSASRHELVVATQLLTILRLSATDYLGISIRGKGPSRARSVCFWGRICSLDVSVTQIRPAPVAACL